MNKKKLLYTRKIAEEKKTDIVLCAFQRFLRDKIASVFLIKLSCSGPGLRTGVATFLIPYCCRCGFKKIQWFFMENQILSICHSPNPIQAVSFQGCSRMGGGWSVVYFVTAKETHSEPSHGYDNFFCIIFLVKKFLQDKFLICVTLSAFVKYFTTNPIIRTMHSHRIPFGSNLINLIRESSRNDHEFIQLMVCAKVTT